MFITRTLLQFWWPNSDSSSWYLIHIKLSYLSSKETAVHYKAKICLSILCTDFSLYNEWDHKVRFNQLSQKKTALSNPDQSKYLLLASLLYTVYFYTWYHMYGKLLHKLLSFNFQPTQNNSRQPMSSPWVGYSHIWACCDDPRFWAFQSDWVPILSFNTIWLTPSFYRKNHFVSITFSSRDIWT